MTTLRIMGSTIVLIGLVSLSPAALADAPQALATAARHAGMAAAADDIAGARRHLHHALNCLVGPNGEGFDEAAGTPCSDAGGAIPQTTAAQIRDSLQQVAMNVRDALENGDLAGIRNVALSTQETLE